MPSFTKIRHSQDAKAVLSLLALTTLLFAPMVCARQVFYWADYALVFYPWHAFAQQCWRAGALPLWNPYVFGGMPFLANLQSAVFYPVNLLTAFAAPHRAFFYAAWIHVALAGLFQYGFLRSLRLSVLASFLGATCFMLGGFIVCRLQYPTILAVCVWTPLLCWLLERLGQRPTLQNSALVAAVFGIQLLAGHLQMAAMSVMLLVGFVFSLSFNFDNCRLPTADRRLNLLRWAYLGGALCLGALLASMQLLPALGTLRESTRADVDYDFISIYSLPPWQMTMFLLPASFGHPSTNNYWGEGNYYELCAYFGVLPLILALVTLFRPSVSHRHVRAYFAVMAAIGLLLAFGCHAPFYYLYSYIPGFGSFKGPGRFLFLVAFGGSGLAALGAEELWAARRAPLALYRRLTGALTALMAGILALLLFAQGQVLPLIASALRHQFQRIGVKLTSGDFATVASLFHHTLSTDVLRVLVLLLALRLALRFVSRLNWMAYICTFVLLADLLLFGWQTIPTTDERFYSHTPAPVERLRRDPAHFRLLPRPDVIVRAWSDQYVSFNSFGDTSLTHLRGWLDLMAPNLNMCYKLASVEGYEPLRPARWHALLMRAQDRLSANPHDTKLLDLLNTKYVATLNRKQFEGSPAWRRVWDGRPHLFENQNVLPHAWLVWEVKPVKSWENAMRALEAETFEPRDMAVVECLNSKVTPAIKLVGNKRQISSAQTRPSVQLTGLHSNHLALRCQAASDSFLILSEAWSPGWSAALNEQPQPLWRANGVLRGVSIPQGRHDVKMVYMPTEFRVGVYLTLAAIACTLAIVWGTRRGYGNTIRTGSNSSHNLTAPPAAPDLPHAQGSARPEDAAASAPRPRSSLR